MDVSNPLHFVIKETLLISLFPQTSHSFLIQTSTIVSTYVDSSTSVVSTFSFCTLFMCTFFVYSTSILFLIFPKWASPVSPTFYYTFMDFTFFFCTFTLSTFFVTSTIILLSIFPEWASPVPPTISSYFFFEFSCYINCK